MPASDATLDAIGARRDRLTGLIPAAVALARIADWQRAAELRGHRACVQAMLVRLGSLAAVNLAHGSAQGDDALVEMAGRLVAFCRGELGGTDWLVARVGGDAFLLASNHAVSRERWQWLAEALDHRLARPLERAARAGAGPPAGAAPGASAGKAAGLATGTETGARGGPAARPSAEASALQSAGRAGVPPLGPAAGAPTPGRPIRLRPRIALARSIPGEVPERLLARLADTIELHPSRALRLPAWVDASATAVVRGSEQLEADLASALERGGVGVAYQPQFACVEPSPEPVAELTKGRIAGRTAGRIVGAEALARWQHPRLGTIGPDALFAIAERAGLARQVSQQIMRTALADASAWPRTGPEPLRLSLNVAAADLFNCGFERLIAAALADCGFAAERLTLEITESALVCDLERTARSLRRLTASGTRIALDDFGAGFCNFRYLKMLPLDDLKLDRGMVQGIGEDPRDLAVLRGIVAMARALGLEVTAEGIETEAQRAIVAAEGCARWQGFLGAPALSAGEFARLASG